MRRRPLPFLLVLLAAGPAQAKTETHDTSWCGFHPALLEVQKAAHRQFAERPPGRRAERSPAPLAVAAGDIAVLFDDGALVHTPNPFDLPGTGMQFTRKKTGLLAASASAALVQPFGNRLELTDDSSLEVGLPRRFRFPYFGKVFTKVWINSDGNLTFGAADFASTERSVARFLNGPPRIAPLFADLDPEKAPEDGGVFLSTTSSRVTVTWHKVPQFGEANENTFQVSFFNDGKIVFAFGEIAALEAVTGVAPGGGGQLSLIDFSAGLPRPLFKTALAERFGTDRQQDDLAIASRFFSEFADDYDHLIVWLDFPLRLGNAFAYEFTVKNEIQGIGAPVVDSSRDAGSKGRLRSFVQMGSLGRYPSDPDQTFLGTNSTLDVLGQETGHRWLAFLRFQLDGGASTQLLGRDLAHWSFYADSDASDMEGNDLRDDGGGRFTTVAATERFSLLDQYVMGLVAAEEVPPTMLVLDAIGANPEDAPAIGVAVRGRRHDVPIADIVAVHGERVPPAAAAPKQFNMAFILVTQSDELPAASVEKLDRIRARWQEYFSAATDGRGAVDAALRRR